MPFLHARQHILLLLLLMICHAASSAQEPAASADQPTTVVVNIKSKRGYQVDVWIDGRRKGYPPLSVALATGQHFLTAGHPDLLPTLDVVDIVQPERGRQTLVIDNVLLSSDNYHVMFSDLVKSYGVFPNNKHLSILAASLTRDRTDYEGMLSRLDEASRAHPMVRLAKVRFALKQDRIEEAERVLDQLENEYPTMAAFWQMKARLLIKQQKYNEAIHAGSRAVAFEPMNPWNFVARADAYMFGGESYNARLDYERALELDENNQRAVMGLEMALKGEAP